MNEREFKIDTNNAELELYYDLNDSIAQSVCLNELEIPQECIKKIICYEDAFKVYLTHSRGYYRDDWYVNLQRLEFVS